MPIRSEAHRLTPGSSGTSALRRLGGGSVCTVLFLMAACRPDPRPVREPDAIALIDRKAGYLWTGDSLYEGPIWLFAPETDLDAYETSVARLAALAPELTTVFPAHNTPVASPDRLVQLRDAIAQVRAGNTEGRVLGDGETEHEFDGFSLLMRSEDPEDSR